jgi:hypothetical protein
VNPATETTEPGLVGIRGWLILPAIYLIGGGLSAALRLIVCLAQFPDVADTGYRGPFALQVLLLLGYLIFLIYAASRFFAKKRNAPSAMVGFWIAGVVADGLIRMIGVAAAAKEFEMEPLFGLIINATIWIIYFRVSKRVKATFVN